MVAITRRYTIEEFERLPDSDRRWELINGELAEVNAASANHGAYESAIITALYTYLRPQRLGRVYGSDTGFVLSTDPPMVRMADVSVILAARQADLGDPDRFINGAPDVAVEIVSPTDRASAVLAKADLWIATGVRLLWVVDPSRRTVTVYTPASAPRTLTDREELDGGALLPGFRLPVAEIFSL